MVVDLARCWLSPYQHATRLPTAYGNKSALFHSYQRFEVPIPQTGTAQGRFAYFVQPKLGDPSSPTGFKIGLVDFSSGFPSNLSSPDAYVRQVGQNYLPMDPNTQPLTQTTSKVLGLSINAVPDLADPLATATVSTVQGTPVIYGLDYIYRPVVDAAYPQGGYDVWVLNPGSYSLNVYSKWVGLPATGEQPLNFEIYQGAVHIADAVKSSTSIREELIGGGYAGNGNYFFTLAEGQHMRVSVKAGITQLTYCRIRLNSCSIPGVAWNANNGLTESVRPVAMSALSSCRASTLVDGGTMVTLFTPPDFADKIFTDNQVPWVAYENLSMFQNSKRTTVKKGSYVWWSPSSEKDTWFRDVSEANAYQYPCFLIAGIADKDAGTALTVEIEFVYEVLTASQLFDQKKKCGSSAIVDNALVAVSDMPHVTENSGHGSLLKDLSKVIGAAAPFAPLLMGLL